MQKNNNSNKTLQDCSLQNPDNNERLRNEYLQHNQCESQTNFNEDYVNEVTLDGFDFYEEELRELELHNQNQAKSLLIYEEFLSYYGLGSSQETGTQMGCNDGVPTSDFPHYPEYYGGAYINEEGILVIHIVGDKNNANNELRSLLGREDSYVTTPARFKYNDFLAISEQLKSFLLMHSRLMSLLVSFGPDDRNNLYLIEMKNLDEENIKYVKSFLPNRDMFIFRQADDAERDATVRPGQLIQNGNSTMGFRARRLGVDGFVMSGHATSEGATIRPGGILSANLGSVTHKAFNSRTDAAFVAARNNTTLSNLLQQDGTVLNSGVSTAPVGTRVFLARGTTNTISSGTVQQVNQTVPFPDGNFTGTRASYTSQGGDSGGPVFTRGGNNNSQFIAGNHVGFVVVSGTRYGIFGLITHIRTDLNVTLF